MLSAGERDALEESLRQHAESLTEVQAILATFPDSKEALQLQQELQGGIRSLQGALTDIRDPPVEEADGADLQLHSAVEASGTARTQATSAAYITSSSGPPELPSHRKRHANDLERDRQRQKRDTGSQRPSKPQMHPANLYGEELDFQALAQDYPALLPYVKDAGHARLKFQFTSQAAARELTRALLHRDFGIDWWIPDGQLIPPVPNRANYIHWLHDLLSLSSPAGQQATTGLDIGCGANLIYPLLGAALYGWHFTALDVTDVAVQWAQRNVDSNLRFAALIEVRRSPEDCSKGIIAPALHEGDTYAFTMCNPPFFGSIEEAGQNPATAFGGTREEMVCEGGEDAFLRTMVEESLLLRGRIHWYTSMVGKKATLKAMRQLLTSHRVTALRTTEFVQGRTMRWGLAWSFSVPTSLALVALPRGVSPAARSEAPARPNMSFTVTATSAPRLHAVLEATLCARGCTCTADSVSFTITASAAASTSRSNDSSDEHKEQDEGALWVGNAQRGNGDPDACTDATQHTAVSREEIALPMGDSQSPPARPLDQDLPSVAKQGHEPSAGSAANDPRALQEHQSVPGRQYSVQVRVLQHTAGELVVRASVASGSSDAVLQDFKELIEGLQADVVQMLS